MLVSSSRATCSITHAALCWGDVRGSEEWQLRSADSGNILHSRGAVWLLLVTQPGTQEAAVWRHESSTCTQQAEVPTVVSERLLWTFHSVILATTQHDTLSLPHPDGDPMPIKQELPHYLRPPSPW